MPDPLYFCELLPNIKQVSVSIESEDGEIPSSVGLHPSKRALTVRYGTRTTHIMLPTPVDSPSITLPPAKTYRLSASQTYLSAGEYDVLSDRVQDPWDASFLSPWSSFCCVACTTTIVPRGRIQKWKNLPSEHWADMMDLWHCHKPHNKDGDSEGSRYSGVGRIVAEHTVGLVDPMYFLLRKEDCDNTGIEQTGSNEAETVICQLCNVPLGIVDAKADGVRLMKWSLSLGLGSLKYNVDEMLDSYTLPQWLSAHLQYLVDNTGQRKFLIKPGASILSQQHLDGSGERTEEVCEGLHIWVFNPNTLVTRSEKPTPTRAVKVYYQKLISKEELDGLGDIETVYLPRIIHNRFERLLEEVNTSLPKELRTWAGSWKGGWLERF
ncbi:hypothetical protein TWF730_002333 [Orbilia blumenaviensis]|uniref:Ubiquitin-conjugating enzyme E2-binding protein n=1 Tax=Orbilia blumenaviensis TaxID=1796055 RepID=A0AAV9U9R4_9PEZI